MIGRNSREVNVCQGTWKINVDWLVFELMVGTLIKRFGRTCVGGGGTSVFIPAVEKQKILYHVV
jgi:hypothetical protein